MSATPPQRLSERVWLGSCAAHASHALPVLSPRAVQAVQAAPTCALAPFNPRLRLRLHCLPCPQEVLPAMKLIK